MSLTAWIAAVKDFLIIAAVLFLAWWVWHSGTTSVKLADLKAVQRQLNDNAAQEQAWKQAAAAAELKHDQELSQVEAAIREQRAPVYILRGPSDPSPVRQAAPAPEGADSTRRADDAGAGSTPDIRSAVNAYELRWEKTLMDCRQALASWPQGQ